MALRIQLRVESLEVDRRFIGAMTEAVRDSETSVYFNEITRNYVPEGCDIHTTINFHYLILFSSFAPHISRVFWK
jgi:hypothetical protein